MATFIPDTMLAAGVNENTGILEIKRVPVPHPGKGEVLVKISAAPVNPSDLARIRNLRGPDDWRSFISGIEGSGRVIARGSGLIPGLWLGKRVSCSSARSDSGSWAEYMVTKAMDCIPLPDSISDEQGSMMLVNPLTAVAFFSIIRKFKHKAIINTAAGSSLGRFIEFLAKQHGIQVIHIVRNNNLKNILAARGAQYILDSSLENFPDELRTLTFRLNATLALDAVGGSLTRTLLMALPYEGCVMVYGNLSGEQPETDHRTLVTDHKSITGFYLVNWLKKQNIFMLIKTVLKARKLIKESVQVPVQARFPLSNVQIAIDTYLDNMSNGKVLLIP
jgi:NADPH2:quinone reductase